MQAVGREHVGLVACWIKCSAILLCGLHTVRVLSAFHFFGALYWYAGVVTCWLGLLPCLIPSVHCFCNIPYGISSTRILDQRY